SMNPATITSVLLPLPAVDLSAFGALWHAGRWWADVGVRSSSRGGVVSRVLDPCGSGSVFEHGVQQYGQGVIGDGLQGTVEQNIGPGAVRTPPGEPCPCGQDRSIPGRIGLSGQFLQ